MVRPNQDEPGELELEVTKDHEILENHKHGKDSWVIRCACGRSWYNWRWLCQEYYEEHLPMPEPKDTWGGYHNHLDYISGAP